MTGLDDESNERPADELRRVARYQRWLIASVVTQVGLWLGTIVLMFADDGVVGSRYESLLLRLTVILGCVGGVCAFLIYWTVRDPFWAVAMGLASVPPFLGVFALAVVNGTATRELAASGVAVGLFGADADAIPDGSGFGVFDPYEEDAGW